MSEIIYGTTIQPELIISGLFGLIFISVFLYTRSIPQGAFRWWISAVALVALLIVAFQVHGITSTILLDLAVLAAVALVWSNDTPQTRKAAQLFLILALIAMVLVTIALVLAGELTGSGANLAFPMDKIVVSFILIGFSIKLALVPLYFWLPKVTESSSVMTSVLIISTLDIAEFCELFELRASLPWVFQDFFGLWLAIALLSLIGGALLALAQTDLKRMLAFSTIDDMGYLLIGILAGTQIGFLGAFLGALSHALFKVVLFGAVGIAEYGTGKSITLSARGLASKYPWSSAAFILASLGYLGVPPLFGFLGRWRLYLIGLEIGGIALIVTMAVGTGLALFYYVRAIHRVWLGTPTTENMQPEPKLAALVLVSLVVIALILGLLPGLILTGV